MRVSVTLVACVIAAGGIVIVAPAVGALDVGCVRADQNGVAQVTTLPAGTSTLFTPPGADVLGWTPECVIIPNGGSITFTQRDLIGHGARSDAAACFDLGVMSLNSQPTTTLELTFDLDSGIAYTIENGADYGACVNLVVENNAVLLPYHCIIHGPGMPGRIVVEL